MVKSVNEFRCQAWPFLSCPHVAVVHGNKHWERKKERKQTIYDIGAWIDFNNYTCMEKKKNQKCNRIEILMQIDAISIITHYHVLDDIRV